MNEGFDTWYENLASLADLHGENVSNRDAWREEWEAGKSAEEAFYDEYPEYEDE